MGTWEAARAGLVKSHKKYRNQWHAVSFPPATLVIAQFVINCNHHHRKPCQLPQSRLTDLLRSLHFMRMLTNSEKNNLTISMKNVDVDTSIICMLSPLTTNQPTADTPVTYERPDTRPESICRPRLLSTTCLQSCDTSRWPRRQACCGHCVETSVTCEL